MKILFLTEFFPKTKDGAITGGSEGRTYYLATELAKMGHDVEVITTKMPESNTFDKWGNLKIFRIYPERDYVRVGSLFSRAFYFINTLREGLTHDFDVVDGNNVACYFLAVLLAKLKGKKSAYWVPDIVGLKDWIKALGPITGSIAAVIELISVHIPVDHIISLSETTTQKLYKLRVNPKKITVVYPPILTLRAKSTSHPKKRPIILSVNRLVQYKRTDLPIMAMAKLKPGERFEYHIVGTGTFRTDLNKLVSKLKLDNQVKFLGGITKEELLEEMANADLFSLPSEIEGFGIVTMEAMGFGTPFLNSAIPVHKEIFANSGGGLLFEIGSVTDFLSQYQKLITDKKLYRKLSNSAYSFASKHSQRFAAKEAEKVYKNLLK